jgi:ferric-dicitrate binding protein FerR (iron transport regulator)
LENRKLKQLFRRYLLGQAREKESGAMDHWYGSFDQDPPVNLSPEEERLLRQEMWAQIRPQMVVTKTFTLRRVAAAAAILLAGTGLAYFLLQQQTTSPAAYTEVITKAGEKRTLHMKDGSTLVINAGSTIRISERKVNILDGEVFVDVQQHAGQPFVVESGPLTTTVLGTSFNVSAYQALHNLSVAVVSGKVKVNKDILLPQQELVYDKQTGIGTISPLDESTLEWQQGRLVLNDVSFEEMVVMMQKNFGITIIATQEQVKKTRYTTELSTVMEPEKAAQVLAAIHHLKVKNTNNQILIYE